MEEFKSGLKDSEIISKYRTDDSHFTRSSILNFQNICLSLLTANSDSYDTTLNAFLRDNQIFDDETDRLTSSALCKARDRIDWTYFEHIAATTLSATGKRSDLKTWHGRQLKALDGSEFVVPKRAYFEFIDELRATGERYIPQEYLNPDIYKLRVSQVYDPLNRITYALDLNLKDQGEKPFAITQKTAYSPGDIVLADRGYEARYLFAFYLLVCECDFVIRACIRDGGQVRDFVESGEAERLVPYTVTNEDKRKLNVAGHDVAVGTELMLRYVRVELDNGELEVLITSLVDSNVFPASEFKELYNMRWGVEESFKIYKCQIVIEKWHGNKLSGIRQELYLAQFLTNIIEMLAACLPLGKKKNGRRYNYLRNFANLLRFTRKQIIKALLGARTVGDWVAFFINEGIATAIAIRPGRKRTG